VSHREADVPEDLQDLLDESGHGVRRAPRVQEEEVHVGGGRQLPPAVAPEGHHRALLELALHHPVGAPRRHLAGPGHDHVDLVAAPGRDLRAAQPEAVPHAQPLGLELQEALEGLDLPLAVLGQAGRVETLPRMDLDRLPVDLHPAGVQQDVYRAAEAGSQA